MENATYVITGGPCTGKTTLCDALADRGFSVVPEAARAIIAEEQRKPQGVLPWTDLSGFQELVYHRQVRNERAMRSGTVFCDRGIVDNIGYCNAGNIPAPSLLERAVAAHRYTGVFVLEPLPRYQADGERKEDAAEGVRLHQHIIAAYRSAGYLPVHVPAFEYLHREASVRTRAEYIISMIGGKQWNNQMQLSKAA